MRHILVAFDLTEGSANALRRGLAMAGAGTAVCILHVLDDDAPEDAAAIARRRVRSAVRELTRVEPGGESGISIRICRGDPGEIILDEAMRLDAALIVLGAHGVPRLRDAIMGTTASQVVRDATHPVLVCQIDADQTYATVMVAVDRESADQILDLTFDFAAPAHVHVVHAFGSAQQSLMGGTERLEDVRADQDVLIAGAKQRLAAAGVRPALFEAIVEEGDEMSVIMRAWTKVNPDLVVMGTHGRRGFAHLLHGSLAETALLGCPSDMLIMRTGQALPGS